MARLTGAGLAGGEVGRGEGKVAFEQVFTLALEDTGAHF